MPARRSGGTAASSTAELHDALAGVDLGVMLAGKASGVGDGDRRSSALVGVLTTIDLSAHAGATPASSRVSMHRRSAALADPLRHSCGVFALTVQVLVRGKFLGYLVMVVYLLANEIYTGSRHGAQPLPLPIPARAVNYSDMNGWGHLLAPYLWHALYWGFLCLVFLVLTALFFVRGSETAWRHACAIGDGSDFTPYRPGLRRRASGSVGFIALGCFIFYNTNILNDYVPRRSAAGTVRPTTRRCYRRHMNRPQPKITAVHCRTWTSSREERRVEIRGRYTLLNKTSQAITDLHLSSITRPSFVNRLELPRASDGRCRMTCGATALSSSPSRSCRRASVEMAFHLTSRQSGLREQRRQYCSGSRRTVPSSATGSYFPLIGYNPSAGARGPRRQT